MMSPQDIPTEDRRKYLLYTAGPITSNRDGTMAEHVARARDIAVRLRRAGWSVVCPHLNSIEIVGFTLDDYLAEDFRVLRDVDALVLLPFWRNSLGTRREIGHVAETKPVSFPIWDWTELLGGE